MNKTEFIEQIADSAELTKVQATRALQAITDGISGALQKDDQVVLVGFGTFGVRLRAARSGRNPKTGEPIQIKEAKVPFFKAGKGLKDVLQENK